MEILNSLQLFCYIIEMQYTHLITCVTHIKTNSTSNQVKEGKNNFIPPTLRLITLEADIWKNSG